MKYSIKALWVTAILFSVTPMSLFGQTLNQRIGYDRLVAERGSSLENGAGIRVLQAEAPEPPPPDGNSSYMPDTSLATVSGSEFFGKSFTNGTTPVIAAANGHANSVGSFFYGNNTSIARGITDITGVDANDFLNRYTGFNTGGAPLTQGFNVTNHSYIGLIDRTVTATNTQGIIDAEIAAKKNIMQRFDFVINRDNTIAVVGANNSSTTPDYLAPSYNAITVGLSGGGHSTGFTSEYGSSRFKPDIVAPLGATSFATPVVGAAAAVLQQTATSFMGSQATDAGQNEVIKSTLFAGATKDEAEFANPSFGDGQWNRTTTRPIDEVFGFGELNIYNSYNIMKGGQFEGSTGTPTTNVGLVGWDYGQFSGSGTLSYLFEITPAFQQSELSAALVWNADVSADPVNSPFLASALADLNLELLDSNGSLIDSSFSTDYNYEHLHQLNLASGLYTFRISGNAATDFGFSWRVSTVPEPSCAILLGISVPALVLRRTRRRINSI